MLITAFQADVNGQRANTVVTLFMDSACVDIARSGDDQ